MFLEMPADFEPRYDNFQLNGFLDETMREGAERCPFSLPGPVKVELAQKILRCGVKDLIFGSGPADPDNIAELVAKAGVDEELGEDWSATFILLLNCWEPIYQRFLSFPDDGKDKVVISLAMLDYKKDERLFERVVDKFRSIGFTRFRVSLLNNFKSGVDEKRFANLTESIDRSVALGIDVVRINDSLGEIFPETLAILCANLRTMYPDLHFCLHAHDDRGLGLQNALTTIYYGFDIIESSFAGFGNRSGLPAIETLNEIFLEKNITIKGIEFSGRQLIETAREVERTFFAVPHVYRPTSGLVVNWENMGVANIPDYLGAERDARRFLNDVGLHPQTISRLLEAGKESGGQTENMVPIVSQRLNEMLHATYDRKRQQFDEILQKVDEFYTDGIVFESDARELAARALTESTLTVRG